MAAAPANRGLVGLLKKGWNEWPELMVSGGAGLFGFGLLWYTVKRYYDTDGNNRPYRDHVVVYRHDDPRVARLKTQCDLTSKP